MLMPILYIIVLIACIKLLNLTDKPLLCAGLYSCAVSFLGLCFGNWLAVLINLPIVFFYTWGYFWLLVRFTESGLYWLILFGGLFLPAAIRIGIAYWTA
jgi:hypothetical protein